MLGLLELMASQGISEDEMYRTALLVNSYWFPETYINLARYFNSTGIPWDKVNPKEVLGADGCAGGGENGVDLQKNPVRDWNWNEV